MIVSFKITIEVIWSRLLMQSIEPQRNIMVVYKRRQTRLVTKSIIYFEMSEIINSPRFPPQPEISMFSQIPQIESMTSSPYTAQQAAYCRQAPLAVESV